MKVLINTKCKVGAIEFDVRWSEEVLKKMELAAHISSVDQMIRLSHRKNDQVWLQLLHEVCHGVVNELGIQIEGDIEAAINALSTGIAVFLNSLDIEPDFSNIPEEFSK